MPPISRDRWRALGPYLDEALEIERDDRAAWLESICARDAALGAELKSLLAEHEDADEAHFLEGAVALSRPTDAPTLEGQIIGAYRLISLIGKGGMGSVWLAERCDGRFEARAAVKLLNAALVGHSGEERFRREGNFLAKVTHPHIARLFDAGVSPGGQPYLVLEHVDGQAIDAYCETHALGIEARIRLFLDVLEAVAHAHANLIVHRDIKPANVFVSTDAQVKLLDFGIAKLLDEDAEVGESPAAHSRALTREAGTPLTPQFAAPEQLTRGQVTTATDVYALGVLLYLLLSGRHPVGDAAESPATLIRAIVEVEPRRMSDVVVEPGHAADATNHHAAQCGTTAVRLRRVLQGDLDTIVAKALKKDAAERYVSVTAYADDLRRFLRHEPISARPDTLHYRTSRFVRRHVRGLATAAVITALVAGFVAFYSARLARERDRAQREAAKAAKVSEALAGLLGSADPIASRAAPGGITMRGLLDAGAERVQVELAGQPEAQAEIFTVFGRLYRRLGIYDKAQHLLEQALASGRSAYGPDHVTVAQTLNDLGGLAAEKGDYQLAAACLEEALSIRRQINDPEHTSIADTLAELGRIYQDQGSNDRAAPLQREALRIRRKALGDENGETAVSLSDLASVLRLNGNLAGAEALLRQSLELNRKIRGEGHAMTATTLHDLALTEAAKGESAVAEAEFRSAMGTHRKALGESHPLVAVTLNSLSRVLRDQGRYDEAAAALQEALAIARPALGGDHQLVAIYALNLAAVHLARNDPEAAEPLAREGLRIRVLAPNLVPNRRRIRPEDDWSIGQAKSLLGAALTAMARYPDAEAVLLDARRELETSSTPARSDSNAIVTRLVELYEKWGRHDTAVRYRAQLIP